MTVAASVGPVPEFDVFGASVAGAVLCGALSTLLPMFVAPTATLSSLAMAGWASVRRRRRTLAWKMLGRGPAISFAILGAGAFGFLDTAAPIAQFRGVLLAGALLPLFFAERWRVPRISFPVFSES